MILTDAMNLKSVQMRSGHGRTLPCKTVAIATTPQNHNAPLWGKLAMSKASRPCWAMVAVRPRRTPRHGA
jgi:hypothetical protein